MKVLELNKMKAATYFDIEVHVPSNINYIATDEDGKLIGFVNEPEANLELRFWDDPNSSDIYEIGLIDLEEKNWTTTLQGV